LLQQQQLLMLLLKYFSRFLTFLLLTLMTPTKPKMVFDLDLKRATGWRNVCEDEEKHRKEVSANK